MLKKIFIIIGLSCSVSPLIYTLDQLKKSKMEIQKGKKLLMDTAGDLKGSFDEQMEGKWVPGPNPSDPLTFKPGMFKELGIIIPEVGKYKDLVNTWYPWSETFRAALAAGTLVPIVQFIAIPTLAIAGDLPDIMRSAQALLNSIYSTLKTIDNTIRPQINDLNYGRTSTQPVDPKGIYKQLNQAIAAFDAVEKKIDEITTAFESAAAALQGPKKPSQRREVIED